MKKGAQYQIKGISQDLAYQLFNPQYAFEMRNMRINTTDHNSLLSLTNEKGTSLSRILEIEGEEDRQLTVLGVGTFADYCVLFCTDIAENEYETRDFIFKLNYNESIEKLFEGNLDFDTDHPIRTVCVFENEKIQKVYWVDGKNSPRVINVAGDKSVEDQKINFLPKLKFQETVSIERVSGGRFPAGVIQYALTYSDKNLQESNIWYVSPLYYSTDATKGAAPGEACNLAFKLNFENLDTSYDYIQIYVIVRTSLNATPAVYRIANISTTTTSFTDNGYQWEGYDTAHLITKQLDTFVPKLIASKDNTLFLGNYTLTSSKLPLSTESEQTFLEDLKDSLYVDYLPTNFEDKNTFVLKKGSEAVKTFRDNEWYRIGIQFQDEYGTPSNIVYLKDITTRMGNDHVLPSFKQKVIKLSLPETIPESIMNRFKRYRLVMVDRETLPHSTICQGMLCPTVYRVLDRFNNLPFAMSSWSMRASNYYLNQKCPEWRANYPLSSNTKVNGGEIENQTDSIEVTDIYWGTNSQQQQVYRYLCVIWLSKRKEESGYQVDPRLLVNVNIRLGRTSNTNATKVKECETIYTGEYFSKSFASLVSEYGEAIYTVSSFKSWVISTVSNFLSSVSNGNLIAGNLANQINIQENFVSQFAENPSLVQSTLLGSRYYDTGAVATDTVGISKDAAEAIANSVGQPFFCDHNILTFHSPDVEKYQSLIDSNDNIKLRIVGYTCMTESYFDSYIAGSPIPFSTSDGGIMSYSKKRAQGIYNAPLWKDSDTNKAGSYLFPTYTWHRIGSLGEFSAKDENGIWYGEYKRKVFSNIHYCKESCAFFDESFSQFDYEQRGATMFRFHLDNTGTSITKAYAASPEGIGAIDESATRKSGYIERTNKFEILPENKWIGIFFPKELYITIRDDNGYYIQDNEIKNDTNTVLINEGQVYQAITKKANLVVITDLTGIDNLYVTLSQTKGNEDTAEPTVSKIFEGNDYGVFPTIGIPRVFNSNEITALKVTPQNNSDCIHEELIYYGNVFMTHSYGVYRVPRYTSTSSVDPNTGVTTYEEHITATGASITDPVYIAYKSTPHIVLPINYRRDMEGVFPPSLPGVGESSLIYNNNNEVHGYLWSNQPHADKYQLMLSNKADNVIYIGELYQDLTVEDIYGDTSPDNLVKYSWIPISDWNNINSEREAVGYGDTFIGRWECLKTYAYSEDSLQSYIDITSAVLESDQNLEGRYDSYKGTTHGSTVTSTNFGIYNDVYTQQNNFFNYRILKEEDLVDNFQNQVCWSEVKTLGEELDTWCQISAGDSMDFQGEYGQLQGLINFQNELYGLQDNAIYKLNYNTRVMISPSDGQAIQISNNFRVDPPLLIKEQCGITNQDALIKSPNSLYFFDEKRGRLFRMVGDQVSELSTEKGVNSLIKNAGNLKKAFYDVLCKDIYFNYQEGALAFNEELDEFTSLYEYHNANHLFTIKDKSFTTKDNKIWKQRTGDYNYFYGVYSPFYIQLLVNNEPLIDKTFSNVEFTMDTVDANDLDAFDEIETWNEYQHGQANLVPMDKQPSYALRNIATDSKLRRKFRFWRANIPRVTGSMDRMRNPWLMIKLSKNGLSTSKYRINNINVNYI